MGNVVRVAFPPMLLVPQALLELTAVSNCLRQTVVETYYILKSANKPYKAIPFFSTSTIGNSLVS